MPVFGLTAVYPTGDRGCGHDWGGPEGRLEFALIDQGLGPILGYASGTLLSTGERDVQIEVATDEVEKLREVIDTLPPYERGLWTVTRLEGDE